MEDDFFGNDPFESIIRNFFGDNSKKSVRKIIKNDNQLRNPIDTKKGVYFIIDFSNLEDINNVKVKEQVIKDDFGEKNSTGNKILEITSKEGIEGKYLIPSKIKSKDLAWNFNNGILEVMFRK